MVAGSGERIVCERDRIGTGEARGVVDPIDERGRAEGRIRHLVEVRWGQTVYRRAELVGAIHHEIAGCCVGPQDGSDLSGLGSVSEHIADPADEAKPDDQRHDAGAHAGSERVVTPRATSTTKNGNTTAL